MRVATWVRVSTDTQDTGADAQAAAISRLVQSERAEVVKAFRIEDVSGSDVTRTKEMRELMQLCERKQIDVVYAYAIDRLARVDNFDFRAFEAFKTAGVTVHTVAEGRLDLNSPIDILKATLLGGMGGYERNRIKDRSIQGRENARKMGAPACGALPLGTAYDKRTKTWSYTPESEKVKQAYEMVLRGETRYNVLGPFLGMTWAAVRNLLQSPIYKGWRYYEKTYSQGKRSDGRQGGQIVGKRDPKDVLRVQVIEPEKALVSPATWERVNQIIESKRANASRRRVTTDEGEKTYQGFLFCDYCGSIITPKGVFPRSKRERVGWGYYACITRHEIHKKNVKRPTCPGHWMNGREVDASIDRFLGKELTSRAFLMRLQMALQARSSDGDSAAKVKAAKKQREALERKRASVVEYGLDGMITKAECQKRLADIDSQIAEATRALDVAQGSEIARMTPEQLAALFKPFMAWECRTREEKRNTLTTHIPRLRVRDGQVVSMYRLLDSTDVAVSDLTWQQATGVSNKISDSKITNLIANGTSGNAKTGKPRLYVDSPSSAPGIWIDVRCA